MEHTFSIKGVLKQSYGIIKADFWNIVGKFFLIVLFGIILSAMTGHIFILNILVSTLLGMAINVFALSFAEGKDFSFETFADYLSWKKFFYYFAAALIGGLMAILGFILLIVPGVLIALRFAFVKYIAVDKNLDPIEILKESVKMTKGNRGQIFLFFLLALLINVGGLICFAVGVLFTFPLTSIAFALVYKKLSGTYQETLFEEETVEAEIVEA